MLRPPIARVEYHVSGADKRSGQSYVRFCMRPGARTPEELETLFEDAFVVRDRDALAQLFEDGAVLVGVHTVDAEVARLRAVLRQSGATVVETAHWNE